jgi:integrase/recombinase XerD
MGFSQFKRERQYLNNVSESTLEWYTHAFKWLPSESPTQEELKDAVLRMREKGLKATGCNSAIRAINAYMHWAAEGSQKCSPQCKHPRIAQLKEPDIVLPTFTPTQVRQLVRWKPKGFYQRRLHLIVLFLFDTGCRITEALKLRVREIDLDNMLVTLDGKGQKQRVVPFSFELRKALFRYIRDFRTGGPIGRKLDALLFANRTETRLKRRNVLRDVKNLCKRLGFKAPARSLHACRHTFALNYLRRGGSTFHLQKVLGHSTLEMTRRYVNLLTEDLQAVHERVSLLASA